MRVNYIYKKESDGSFFTSNSSIIELKEYMSDLVFYSPMNNFFRAEYAQYNKAATYEEKPLIFTGGPFGSYLKLIDKYSFDLNNFESIEDEARISFWLGSNHIVNNSTAGLRAKKSFPETGLPAGSYSLTVTVEGRPTSTMILKCSDNTSIKQLKNKILFSLDPVVYPFELNSANNEKDLIVLQSSTEGKTIKITDGLDGINLLDYFDVENVDFGSAPNKTNKIFELYNLAIYHFRNLDDGNSKSYLRFILEGNENQIIEVPWNNNTINLDNIEINFDNHLVYIFINGVLLNVQIVKNKFKNNGKTLSLFGYKDYQYSFDEIIINKKCIHVKDFEVADRQLTKYSTAKPYIDYNFSGAEIKKGMELKTNSQIGIHCVLCEDGNYYYYNAGAWRRANGEFKNTNDWYTFAEKIKEYTFNNKDFFIRCFFVSDGVENSYLDTPFFVMEDESYTDQEGNIAAILVGSKEWSNEYGEPIKEYLNGKKLIITTDQGSTSIDFTYPTDKDSNIINNTGFEDDSYPKKNKDGFYTIQDVIDEINSYYPDGIASCLKDDKEHVVLVSETKGVDSFITVSGDAAPIIFGDVTSVKGSDATTGTIDYKTFYKAVRTYTGSPIISMEVTDEQMKLFLKEALAYYKRFKADDINQYTCQLKGDWQNGYEIPAVIESQKDIVDIIFRPIFPITFYGADFIANGSENIFSLTLAQSLFGGRGGTKQSSGITQDYYISLMGMQDFRQTLGLNPTWEIMNNRIYIFPSQVSRFTNVSIRYKAPLSEEECLKDPDMIKYVHGKCLMTMGNIRGQYGSNLTAGEAQLTFNSDALYERGKAFVDEVLEYWKKSAPPMGFFLG